MEPSANLIIITGFSGAGKSHALKTLEDLDYFCVDNLPPSLIPKFMKLCDQAIEPREKIALVVDIRGGEFFQDLDDTMLYMKSSGINPLVLFLEADDDTLIQRYKLTRRRHPLSLSGGILEGIKDERSKLESIRKVATKIIDTSRLTPRDFRKQLIEIVSRYAKIRKLIVSLVTFGFKHGLPKDADLVFDVRFLPNPYYVPKLRPRTGLDPKVSKFVLDSALTKEFLKRFIEFVDFLLPNFIDEGKTHLTIAIGCTGGQHRSVTIGEYMKSYFENKEHIVTIEHRDIQHEQ